MYKFYLDKAGIIICLNNKKSDIYIYRYYLLLFFIVFAIVLVMLLIQNDNIINIVWFLFIVLGIISIGITGIMYKKINGIYENGIINNKYYTWDEIHSYELIEDNAIAFLLKSGNKIVIGHNINVDIIIKIMNKNILKKDIK
jgi:hypothetical protein